MKYSSIISKNHSMLTEKLINSNKLSKYLTGPLGKKDHRTTEQREVDKCTFNPKVCSKHRRYKAYQRSYYTETSRRTSPNTSVLKSSLSSKKNTYSV